MGLFYGWLSDELSLFIRQLAWLHAVPEIKTGKTKKRGEKSRIQQMKERGETALMPPNPAPHITDWLLEIGPLGADAGALSWRDLAAWQGMIGVELEPWEARLIRRLSSEFATMRHKAEKADCPPPWSGTLEDVESGRDRVATKVRALFGGRR